MNNNRPSKPNLPNVPKPSKLLAPMRLRRTYFFSSFPDSSTLFLSLVKSLRGFLPKPFLTISISVRGRFGVLGSSQEGTNFILVDVMVKQWNPRSQKRNRFSVTLLEQEAQRAQIHWVDQAWKVYCCSCIPTTLSSGLLTAWRAAERFYAESFGFLFDNTSLCCPCVCISLPLSQPFIFCYGCDFKLTQIVYQLCLQLVFIFRTLCVCHKA